MSDLSYYSEGHLIRLKPLGAGPSSAAAKTKARAGSRGRPPAADFAEKRLKAALGARSANRFQDLAATHLCFLSTKGAQTCVIPTETIILESPGKAAEKWLRDKFGARQIDEGLEGKALFAVPPESADRIGDAFRLSREASKRGDVQAAHPNFIRAITKLSPGAATKVVQWALDNPGSPGLSGADVAARAAWTITRGSSDVVVAVLDEGVDTKHPMLRSAIVKENDFVDDNPHARPDADDAHGTACAGIVAARSSQLSGLAPQTSLMAARIAKDDGQGNWVFDDFRTADAIDWAWRNGADVLSNSWGGGPPVDVITRAFERARTQGRRGKGCVIVVAAGNEEGPVSYPGTLPYVVTVGASNEWDERKTHASQDGEDWWGSNFGPALDILAPGVHIATTDIQGRRGYSRGNVTTRFNGTSSATPHVAAAAAMLLSVAPKLTEQRVREALTRGCDRLPGQEGWNPQEGHGRLNVYGALRAALRM